MAPCFMFRSVYSQRLNKGFRPKFYEGYTDRYLKNFGGHNGRSVVITTTNIRTIVKILLMKIMITCQRNSEKSNRSKYNFVQFL